MRWEGAGSGFESSSSSSSIHKPPPPLWHTWDPTYQKIKKMSPQNGPWNCWKPLTADYVAAGVFFCSEKWPPYFWKPPTCGYVAQGCFFSEKKGPIFLEAPNLWVRCSRLFFLEKKPPDFWKLLTCGYVAQDCFFPEKETQMSGSPSLLTTLLKAGFSRKKGPKIFAECQKGGGGL